MSIAGRLGCSRVSVQAKRGMCWQLEVGRARCSREGRGDMSGPTSRNSVAKSEGVRPRSKRWLQRCCEQGRH